MPIFMEFPSRDLAAIKRRDPSAASEIAEAIADGRDVEWKRSSADEERRALGASDFSSVLIDGRGVYSE